MLPQVYLCRHKYIYVRRCHIYIYVGFWTVRPTQKAASTTSFDEHGHTAEHTEVTEKAVLELINTRLQVPVTSQDISIAHRLKKKNGSDPAPIIVRFTHYKTIDAVYRARFKLKGGYGESTTSQHRAFINEDLAKRAANLFCQAKIFVKEESL